MLSPRELYERIVRPPPLMTRLATAFRIPRHQRCSPISSSSLLTLCLRVCVLTRPRNGEDMFLAAAHDPFPLPTTHQIPRSLLSPENYLLRRIWPPRSRFPLLSRFVIAALARKRSFYSIRIIRILLLEKCHGAERPPIILQRASLNNLSRTLFVFARVCERTVSPVRIKACKVSNISATQR